mgnify:CR=1 FL=1
MDYIKNYQKWLDALKGTQYENELLALKDNEKLMEDSFYKYLEFGTAGMRGILAPGTNRMNIFTVRRCTQGLADYIKSRENEHKGVVIAYDSRNMSDVFAKQTALVLAGNGIKTYLYDCLHSVPQLSFALLQLRCANGVVITASHNPPEYNGYKVYGADGGQAATEDAAEISAFIDKIEDYFAIRPMDEEKAIKAGLLIYIGEEMDQRYYSMVKQLSLSPEAVSRQADKLNIVYTPLYGTGYKPVTSLLKLIGIKNLHVVESQSMPNGDFTGLKAPNPEEMGAYTEAIKLAREVGANMILATDPDCDRLGLCVKDEKGEFTTLTGNQIGCILMDYILNRRQEGFTGEEFVCKSIVSTQLADAIAAAYGVEMRHVLTGFKFIAEQIKFADKCGHGRFMFGFEESYGYLAGTFVRDKDAAMSAMLMAECACWYAEKGMTIYDALMSLYDKYGYYVEKVISITLAGMEGIAKISGAVSELRENVPRKIGEYDVVAVTDLMKGKRHDMRTREDEKVDLPQANVLIFELDGAKLILRPSGTEPKLKAYCFTKGANKKDADEKLYKLVDTAMNTMQELTK